MLRRLHPWLQNENFQTLAVLMFNLGWKEVLGSSKARRPKVPKPVGLGAAMHSVPSRRVRKKRTLEEDVVQVADGKLQRGKKPVAEKSRRLCLQEHATV